MQSKSWHSVNFANPMIVLMLQPLHIHLLSLFHRLGMLILSLFPHHHSIFPSDLLRFVMPLHFLNLRSIASVFVTLLIFAHLPCIKFPQYLHNTAFNIVFPPQMPHESLLLDGFTVTCPILVTVTFLFIRFTFRPLLSSALFQP